jgi:perosamine synthetase
MFIDNRNIKDQINTMKVSCMGKVADVVKGLSRSMLGAVLLIDPQTGKFVDVITDGDVRRSLLNGFGMEMPISQLPLDKSVTARIGQTTEEISLLFSNAVRVIPILDENETVVDLAVFDERIYLPISEPYFRGKELLYINECVLTGWVSSAGKFVTRFEKSFAEFCGVKHAIAVSNGTAALHLSLLSSDIGAGDEVIVPTLTFIATANAVSYTGAKPVFVDSEPETWNLDPDCIEKAISPKTKAIIPVHLYGHPACMEPIMEIADRYNLIVIEDAAEAHGAMYKGKKVGSIGNLGVFSFYGNKIITTGEGGMVVTNDGRLAELIRTLRDHGMDKDRRYWHSLLGYNYRLTNIQAALGCAQMENIDLILQKKIEIAQTYKKLLQHIPGITLPNEASWAKNIFWLYSILIDESKFGMGSDDVIMELRERKVEARPLFPPIHTQPIYATGQRLPVAERISSKGLSLPSSVNLSNNDIERVVSAIADMVCV